MICPRLALFNVFIEHDGPSRKHYEFQLSVRTYLAGTYVRIIRTWYWRINAALVRFVLFNSYRT